MVGIWIDLDELLELRKKAEFLDKIITYWNNQELFHAKMDEFEQHDRLHQEFESK